MIFRKRYTQINNSKAEKLFEVDRSLSTQQLEGVGFICAGLVPNSPLYEETTESKPSVGTCLEALERNRNTQTCASDILLTGLEHVGCGIQLINELQPLLSPQHNISPVQIEHLRLRMLLYDVCVSLTGEDQRALILLSKSYLNPPHDTKSLFVHLNKLIEQQVIKPSNLTELYHCLAIMGKQTIMETIRKYCRDNNYDVPHTESMLTIHVSAQLCSAYIKALLNS